MKRAMLALISVAFAMAGENAIAQSSDPFHPTEPLPPPTEWAFEPEGAIAARLLSGGHQNYVYVIFDWNKNENQVSGEPGIAKCKVHFSNSYLGNFIAGESYIVSFKPGNTMAPDGTTPGIYTTSGFNQGKKRNGDNGHCDTHKGSNPGPDPRSHAIRIWKTDFTYDDLGILRDKAGIVRGRISASRGPKQPEYRPTPPAPAPASLPYLALDCICKRASNRLEGYKYDVISTSFANKTVIARAPSCYHVTVCGEDPLWTTDLKAKVTVISNTTGPYPPVYKGIVVLVPQ